MVSTDPISDMLTRIRNAIAVSKSEVSQFREAMERMSARSLTVYRGLVHDNDALFEMFRVATPVEELANARFGSRPAYRSCTDGGPP